MAGTRIGSSANISFDGTASATGSVECIATQSGQVSTSEADAVRTAWFFVPEETEVSA